jgi:hypothetical protein
MRIIIYKFGAFPNQVAKLVHIAHRWILAVPADDKKKAVVRTMDGDDRVELYKVTNNVEDNNYKFSLIHFTDVPGYEDKVPDIIYNTLCDIYQNDIKQTEV